MTLRTCLLAALFAAAVPLSSHAQVQVSEDVKLKVRGMQVQEQYTPQVQVSNVKDKRWRPKNWLEVDIAFDADKARVPGETNPMIDELEFKIFVLLNVRNKEGKLTLLTANITFLNIEEKQEQHAMAFASPSALSRILNKPTFSNADVSAYGVEVYKAGALAGWHTSGAGRWWDKTENFVTMEGVLLPKSKTPFAPLWGDYDLESKN